MKKLLIFVSFLTVYCFAAAADPKPLNIVLQTEPSSGQINPTQRLIIKLDKLELQKNYTVTCHIKDPGNEKNQVIIFMSYINASFGNVYLNGTLISNGRGWGAQGTLPAIDTTLVIKPVARGYFDDDNASIPITNVDQDDAIVVTGCQAAADPS